MTITSKNNLYNSCWAGSRSAKFRRRSERSFLLGTSSETIRALHEPQAYQGADMTQSEKLPYIPAELQNVQACYIELYDQLPVGYLSLDHKGLILAANLTASLLLRITKEAFIGRPLSDFVIPEDQDACALYFRQLLGGGEWRTFEPRLLRKDGAKIWVRLDAGVVRDKASGAISLCTVINDITELKHSEEQLRNGLIRLQAIIDTAVNGIITIDHRGIIRVFNKAAETMLGVSAQEIIGHSINKLMGLSQSFDGCFPSPTEKPKPFRIQREFSVRRKDGASLLLSVGIGDFHEGNERYYTGILRDITEHKQAEQALQDSEERLALVLDASGEGLWDWDIIGNKTHHNDKWYELLGLDKNIPTYTQPSFFITLLQEDDRKDVLRKLRLALRTGERFHSEHRLRRADGSYIWVQENGIVVKRDAKGKPVRMVGSFVDITERKHYEQQQREYHSQYERLLKLEIVNQTVAAIAHDLNQPLSAAASYADAAHCLFQAGNKQPEKLVYALEQSTEQIRRAGQFVHQLFGFLRTGETVTAPLSLNHIVRKVVAVLKEDGRIQQFTVKLSLEKNLPKVQANTLQLEKVLINLLCNGVESMHAIGLTAGSLMVTVCAISTSEAQVCIRDCGQGLDAEAAKRIFEPFYSTKSHGLGMGLAISRALVEAQGGRLWFQADDNPGAAFYLTVPFASTRPL
ncbi:PAS domain S-box protein [Methylovulum psychrotolerans]|uniref:histidine kinase n=1 Tax=Methylovulum psychrotolerans TaxID=1704499 RepID=A0A2S5CGB7_9GAMM|nr:PAS domain S-box protein [Methylovulum psychrotolerans]POZ49853.1 histidine kinase [Methylovulum psychrotolerans]